ncbi:hypothetical protein CPLU01_01069 [Colletotrichum plurivorum]|uniref:Uncharacterized protein n=1 Tax=Colletotrichum plurivorum TaxID=2175906 RepID=A0A8H6NQK1_9PEZI|nr:hypothetical protein CPLU01_01069 [Colletotrichum plurivorum]
MTERPGGRLGARVLSPASDCDEAVPGEVSNGHEARRIAVISVQIGRNERRVDKEQGSDMFIQGRETYESIPDEVVGPLSVQDSKRRIRSVGNSGCLPSETELSAERGDSSEQQRQAAAANRRNG